MIEIWKSTIGAVGYEVSDHGKVRSVDRPIVKRNGVTYAHKGRLLKAATDRDGYQFLSLGDQRKNVKVHRLVLEIFIGPCPSGMEGRHKDSNPSNNRLTNLEWATPKVNHGDMIARGSAFHPQGERCGLAKLSEAAARSILADTRPHGVIATEHGVKKWTVSAIKRGKRWGHLSRVPPTLTDADRARNWTFGESLAEAVET